MTKVTFRAPPLAGPRRIAAWRFRVLREDGNITIEFAIWFPMFIIVLLAAVELGIITARHVDLERSLDLTVRDVRLGTGDSFTHDELKDMICDNSAILPNCSDSLRLEMVRQAMPGWVDPAQRADCIDRSEEARPARTFQQGGANELMVLRVCAKFRPLFPSSGLAARMQTDGAGDYALVATSAFVQEPG